MTSELLRVEGLRTFFRTPRGLLRAVDGVDFSLTPGATLGVVGESGSGKSVTALSVMRLVDQPGRVEPGSRIVFEGRDLAELSENDMSRIRGNDISMIFQEPMTSLNPCSRSATRSRRRWSSTRGSARRTRSRGPSR